MIKELNIRNFQSHENTDIEFSPGVTVITGTSDSGKTAILRGLYWMIKNRPRGNSFIRHGSKTACMALLLDDGSEILRSKTKGSTNKYELNGEVLGAVGSDVPQQIQDTINIGDINIQRQHDPHFLIDSSPGKIAGVLNQITHVEDAQQLLSNLNALLRKASSKLKYDKEQAASVEEELKAFVGLQNFADTFKQAEEINMEFEEDWKTATVILGSIDSWAGIQKEMESLIEIPESVLKRAEEEVKSITEAENEAAVLIDLLTTLGTITQEVVEKPSVDEDDLLSVLDMIQQIEREEKETDALTALCEKLLGELEVCADLSDVIKSAEIDLEKCIRELDVCPTCEQTLTEEAKEKVLKE